jgi:hypothetical protein
MSQIYVHTERESIIRDATSSEGKSPEQRIAIFLDLMATVETILSQFPPAERARRLAIADKLQPRPIPWWRNFRREAVEEYRCRTSSK